MSCVPAKWFVNSELACRVFQALVSQPTFFVVQQFQRDSITNPLMMDLHHRHSHDFVFYPFFILNNLVVDKGSYVLSSSSISCSQILSEFHEIPSVRQ